MGRKKKKIERNSLPVFFFSFCPFSVASVELSRSFRVLLRRNVAFWVKQMSSGALYIPFTSVWNRTDRVKPNITIKYLMAICCDLIKNNDKQTKNRNTRIKATSKLNNYEENEKLKFREAINFKMMSFHVLYANLFFFCPFIFC